jgi:hypothetical protein
MYLDENDQNRIYLATNKAGKKVVDNFFALIIAGQGGGKSVFAESFIEEMQNMGYLVIGISDSKGKYETCANMFPPIEQYHLDMLRKVGKKPSSKDMILYHPFTFNFPKHKVPQHKLFTFPIKQLTREELCFLLETKSDSNNVKLIMQSLPELKKNEAMYNLMHIIYEKVGADDEKIGGKVILKPKGEFSTPSDMAGTRTNLEEIQSAFLPFVKDYFLTPEDCPLNLDMEKLLNDQKHYHVLVTKHIKDQKMKYFAMFSFFKKILDNIELSKYPVCFLIEEIGNLFPRDAKGYQEYFSSELFQQLLIMRSKGRGCSVISTTQTLTSINPDIETAFQEKFIGKIGSIKEINNISKSLKLNKENTDDLMSLKQNRFFKLSSMKEVSEPFVMWFPSSCHMEAFYSFDDLYNHFNKDNPEKYPFINYSDVIKQLQEIRDNEAKQVKEKADKEYKQRKKQAEFELAEKQRREEEKKKEKEDVSERVEQKSATKQELMKRIYEIKKFNEKIGNDTSWRKIAEMIRAEYKSKIDNKTTKKYYLEYEKLLNETDRYSSIDSI